MKKFIVILMLIGFLGIAGCKIFEIEKDQAGVSHTKIETILAGASDTIKAGGQIANAWYPGVGILATGLAALLGLIGHSITSVVTSRKNESVASTAIKGVEVASTNYDALQQTLIDMFASQSDIQTKIKEAFAKTKTVKDTVAEISKLIGNSALVNSMVQKITMPLKT